ncbi:DUF2470 domain-containing protein [Streptomyces showdoensis]|uniref:DUF2470 domain-containing protein n=1 Tax=Streptomyces showdoensis TaxID=68268 RepID=A0A2P2GQD0_STREW|nr:DUF2470 domain-containing protein [Streptomyces showdoensis]KKZ73701.1 hypothetical protein VO63_11320 [Streptomyces showdoensis]
MRPHTTPVPHPTPAERMRSIVTAAHSMTVISDGLRQEVRDLDGAGALGRIHLHEPDEEFGPDQRGPLVPVRLELTDIAPAPVRDRVRARVTLTGLVAAPYRADSAESACMRLGQAVFEDATGRGYVTLRELQAAETDPLAVCEASLLHHLVDAHPELVTLLLRLVEPGALHGLVRALPLAIDRYGITLRLELGSGWRDVRLAFPTPVTDADQVGLQTHALLAAARRASHSHLPAA